MRYGIVSDIHSNLEALEAVLDALSKEKIDKYICVGDIVGYGADARACIKKVRQLNIVTVLGNHDAGCIGFTDLSYFNERAKAAVIWTKEILSQSDLEYLKTLRLVIEMGDFTLAHGTLDNPEAFHYMLDTYWASRSFDAMKTRILFVGHSHVPGIFEHKKGNLKYFHQEKIKPSKNAKYIVNTGSVGQPRDGDSRACFVIYDTLHDEICIKRVEYDIEKAKDKILKASLPPMLADRLSRGM